MSNNNGTHILEAEAVELAAWRREVCALHADLSRPIESDDDPRLAALNDVREVTRSIADWAERSFTGADLGEWYFRTHAELLPAPPLPAPEWSVRSEVVAGEWPDVTITYYGPEWKVGESSVRVEREVTILVDVLPDDWNLGAGGEQLPGEPDTRLPGDVHESTVVRVEAGTSEGGAVYMSLDRAWEVETALGDALNKI